jgi:acetyl esterase/lipase
LAPATRAVVKDTGNTGAIEATAFWYGSRWDQFGELTRPRGREAPWSVAVFVHGGFWRARYDLRLQDRLVGHLADRGWAVWNLEYRRLGWRSPGGWPATFHDLATGIDQLGKLDAPLDLARVVASISTRPATRGQP